MAWILVPNSRPSCHAFIIDLRLASTGSGQLCLLKSVGRPLTNIYIYIYLYLFIYIFFICLSIYLIKYDIFAVLIVNMQYIPMCIRIYKYQSLANNKLIFKSATYQKTTRLIHLHPLHRQVSPCGHRAI